MLPFSAVPSIQEKIRGHKYREDNFNEDDAIEEERNSTFGITMGRRVQNPSYAELLLGPEFEENIVCDAAGARVSTEKTSADPKVSGRSKDFAAQCGEAKEGESTSLLRDWTLRPLPAEVESEIKGLPNLTISVPAANGSTHDIELTSESIGRILGRSEQSHLSWLDDNVMNCFLNLINARSKENTSDVIHDPSKNQDIFSRKRVRTYIFGTHFFEILNRTTNGGYEGVKNWRRKVKDYNSIGVFMFPAFVGGNHWVLAIADVDGNQFIYYDPYGGKDRHNVMQCARKWVSGEVDTASRRDVFKGLHPQTWPVHCNPGKLPRQTDSRSCGIFVLFVAEHFERVKRPLFTQEDIPILRMRALWVLKEENLLDSFD